MYKIYVSINYVKYVHEDEAYILFTKKPSTSLCTFPHLPPIFAAEAKSRDPVRYQIYKGNLDE